MRFPNYRQHDVMDCGPTALKIVAAHYGKSYSIQYLREKCHITKNGVSMLGISDAAESIGFRTNGLKIPYNELCNGISMPCIIYWNQQHFVVVYKIKKTYKDTIFYISDPGAGLLKYRSKLFFKCWASPNSLKDNAKGLVLTLEPTHEFYIAKDHKESKINFKYLISYLKPYKTYLVQLMLAVMVGSLLSLILPFLTQSIVDVGIANNSLDFILVILIAQVMIVVGQTANKLIQNWLMLHITSRISISLISDYLFKLMKLPISYFDSRMVGDIMQRIGDHNRIQDFLTGSLISIVMAVLTFIIYGIIIGGYNLNILLIFLLGSTLYGIWVLLFLRRRRALDYMRFQESSVNQSNLIELINGMQEIKLNNCEKEKRWGWERIQVKLYDVRVKGLLLSQTQEVGGVFIDQTKNVIISFLSAHAVINGNMTLGMMMALQYILGQLNTPISQLINFIHESQDAKISLERLNEVHDQEDEDPEEQIKNMEVNEHSDIIFDNVMFQYEGPHSEKVLNNISLKIINNNITAIVGASGSGKTTLLKLILGFYEPIEGTLWLGDRPMSSYNMKVWRQHCGIVMQEGYIFSDTIEKNIAISEEYPDSKRLEAALNLANIKTFVKSLPLGLQTRIGPDGHGLSSGQKQRLLIARAAYKNAPYLFFDEATNALDANNEKVIMNNLKTLFNNKTVVVVAHRLSTVKNANKIIVLDKGNIVEEGTHQQLINLRGAYYELVHNQLELGD